MEWTSDQSKAIEYNGSDILVSAAAGSGKTAVLVERIIRKLLDKNKPIDIDRLLVVTFTEAAAAEMKEKIIRALQNDGSSMANHQLKLSGGADITTIDSFCLHCVKNNFHNLGIDPGFTICDKAEAELLKEEVCSDLFDSLYKAENEEDKKRFINLTKLYSSNRNDYALRELVLCIYRFIQTFPEPYKWLDEKAMMYQVLGDEIFDSIWVKDIIENIRKTGSKYFDEFTRLLEKMTEILGEAMPYDAARRKFSFQEADNAKDWEKQWLCMVMAADAAKRLSDVYSDGKNNYNIWQDAFKVCSEIFAPKYFPAIQIRGKSRENELLMSFNAERKELIESFRDENENLVNQSAEDLKEQFNKLGSVINDVVWLVKTFGDRYIAQKEKKGIFEFADIEHMTYKLFCDKDIQSEYRDKYDEILIDEYQDTNGLQDAIFNAISKNNIFMVGDLKQSIYRFRGGDPFIFKDKSARFSSGKGGKRIALSQNFRSRKEVLNSVNSLFSCVMSDRVGDVIYDGEERLNREKDYYTDNGCNHKSEIHLIPIMSDSDEDEQTEIVNTRLEAAHIAGQIRKMIDEKYQVMCGMNDDESPVYRDIQSRDITILSSSVRNIGDIYTEELAKQGIKAYIESEGYFDRKEVQLILSLLRLINNNRQDIPLIAVMRSPIGGFTDDELAKIRLFKRDTQCFYDALIIYDGDNEELKLKCSEFIKSLERWRDYMQYKTVAGLLWSLYEETGLYDFMGAFEGGEEAQANLRLLYERAKQYEESGFKGLFNFIKYTERLENRSDDIGSAKIIGENHDVVRIMTIHKSKGLEFPVVFLAGAGKRMRKSGGTDEVRMMNLHKDAGFGMMYIDPENSYYSETIAHKYVKRLNSEEQQSENLRRLYVALTRPKEKLIVTVVMKFKDESAYNEQIYKWKSSVKNGKMSESAALNAGGFYAWLMPVALNDEENWEFKSVRENVMYSSDIYDILNYKYPYASCCRLPSKTTVSEIKRRDSDTTGYSVDYSMTKKPHFAETSKEANVIGTAHHQIMAYINMKNNMSEEYIYSEAERICEMGQISEEDKKNISVEFIKGFFEGKLGKRMVAAYEKGKLRREAPFEISVKANVYEPSLYGNDLYNDDEIIVQGAIDCYFEEEDGIVLIDYKTDSFKGDRSDPKEVQQFIEDKKYDYTIQVELYKEAIETITQKKVKEKYLYLFSTSSIVEV